MDHVTLIGSQTDMTAAIHALIRMGALDLRRNEELEAQIRERRLLSEHSYAVEIPGLDFHEAFRTRMAQLADPDNQDEGLLSRAMTDYPRYIAETQRLIDRLESAVMLCAQISPQKKPMFKKRRPVSEDAFQSYAGRQKELIDAVRSLEDEEQRLHRLEAELGRAGSRRAQLEQMKDLTLPQALLQASFEDVKLYAGVVQSHAALEELESSLCAFGFKYFHFDPLRPLGESLAVILAVHRDEAEALYRSALQNGLSPLPELPEHYAGDYAAALHEHQSLEEGLRAEMQDCREKMKALAENRSDFEALSDFYRVRQDMLRGLERVAQTGALFVVQGYIPQAQVESILRTLTARYPLAVSRREATPEENPPVLLKNASLLAPFEEVVGMFSPPKPGVDVDPTPIMAPTYAFFFGMMLSDVGYGLVLALLTGFLLWGARVESKSMRGMCKVLFMSSIVSMIWGAMFGGFFGDLPKALSGSAIDFKPLWFNPLEDPMKLMLFSVIFGVIHLFLGMGINMYLLIRSGQVYSAFAEVFPWYLIIGAGFGYAGTQSMIFAYLAMIGAGIVLLFSPNKSKNPIKRLIGGLLKLYGITSFLSDILSYTRILALSLATSVIAMVVNMLATLPGATVLGVVIAVPVLLFGHALNLALSGLSAYVHTTRLQYVEFFGRFYTGGGTAFKPFEVRTEYVRPMIEEQKLS